MSNTPLTDEACIPKNNGWPNSSVVNTDFDKKLEKELTATKEDNERMREAFDSIQTLVDNQAEDDGLFFYAETVTEEHLMHALRVLHARIEFYTKSSRMINN